jgi:hypothetical protein
MWAAGIDSETVGEGRELCSIVHEIKITINAR